MNCKKAHIKILFWNSRSILQRKNELPEILRNIDVFICVESWLKANDRFEIPGFSSFRKDRVSENRGGGVLFLVRKNLVYTELKQACSQTPNVELAGLRITNIDPQIDLVACYRPPGHTLTQTEWNAIVKCVDDTSNAILVGDFNAHNKKWNCDITDPNGARLDYSIEAKNLFLHNANSFTHINTYNGNKSNIDLVFSTMPIADKIITEIGDETFGSDYYPITMEIDANRHTYQKQTFKLKSIRTSWEQFREQVELNYTQFLTIDYDQLQPAEKYDFFISIVTESIKTATPRKPIKNRKKIRNPVAWWDSDCDKIKRLRRASFK